MIGVLTALWLLTGAVQSDADRPVVILIYTNDTGFLHPLDTARKAGDLWSGELIAVQSLSEDFTVVRQDMTVEIDCAQNRARTLHSRSYGHHGLLPHRETDTASAEWEPVDAEAWPTLQMLHAIACKPVDLTAHGIPLAEAEERIRARIQDF